MFTHVREDILYGNWTHNVNTSEKEQQNTSRLHQHLPLNPLFHALQKHNMPGIMSVGNGLLNISHAYPYTHGTTSSEGNYLVLSQQENNSNITKTSTCIEWVFYTYI